jgi:hypothetical protein
MHVNCFLARPFRWTHFASLLILLTSVSTESHSWIFFILHISLWLSVCPETHVLEYRFVFLFYIQEEHGQVSRGKA